MPNIMWIRQPELRGGAKEDIAYPLNDGILFTLTHLEGFEQSPVTFAKVEDVVEDVVDESFKHVAGNDRRIGLAKGIDEELTITSGFVVNKRCTRVSSYGLHDVEVLNVLDLLVDDIVNNALTVDFTVGKGPEN
jgi:hypothetical protein